MRSVIGCFAKRSMCRGVDSFQPRGRDQAIVVHHLAEVPVAGLEEGVLAACIFLTVEGVGGEIAPRDHRYTVDGLAADRGMEALELVHGRGIILDVFFDSARHAGLRE